MSTPISAENIIKVIRGDDISVDVAVKDDAGVAIPLTNVIVTFTVKKRVNDAANILQKEITDHSDPTHGITTIVLTNAETDLLEPGTYWWDIQLDNAGVITSTERQLLRVIADITREVS